MPVLPTKRGDRGHVARTRSPKQEKERATKVGGRVTRGSGNGWEKGDVRKMGVIRIECKTTTKKSFSVTQKMLNQIYDAALPFNEIPVIEVEFINEQGGILRRVAIVPDYVPDMIVEQDAIK